MNRDYSKSVEQDVGSDGLPELDCVASMSRDDEESNENEIDYEFSEEDGPPVLEDFHEKTDQRLNFDAATEAVAELNCETHEHSHETCGDYNCRVKSAPFSERCRTNCFRSKDTGHSYKRSNDSFGEHRRGTSHRFHMVDADGCDDNFDSEKDDDKMDEDDDDLTKKLLSIQVLPRIPKLKRTGMSVGGASSESSAPQRSVLERAEVATKSSSYPKWPKSNGSQADDKHRWPNERKGRDAKHGSRNRKETELRTDSSRNFVHSRPSGSNFRRPLDFEKSKRNLSERVPCEVLFDSLVKKEDSQMTSSCKKESNDFDSGSYDSNSCGLFGQAGAASDSADSKIYSDLKDKDSCGSNDQQMPKLLTEEDRRWRRLRGGDNFKRKEGKLEGRESGSSSKVSELKSQENLSIDQSNSCHNSDKHLLPDAFQNHGSSSLGISHHQNGSLSDIKLPAVSNEHANLCSSDAAQAFSQSVPVSTSLKSEDAHFKRPSVSRVPRSKVLEHSSVEHTGSNRHQSKVKAAPMNWNETDGNEQSKFKSPTVQNDSPLLQPVQISPSQLDSVMEVVDMDVVASPLCDDKLLSCEPTAVATTSGARKVVTFDCPEDADSMRRNNSKTSKREKATQQASFETKCDIQKQVVSEMKELLRPLYSKRKINKEEYKEIMRQAVPKLCHNRKTRVASSRIKKYAEKYTSRVLKLHKKSSSQTEKQSAVSVASSFV